MKRTLALFLSFVLTAAAALPVLADDRAVPAPSASMDSAQSAASSAVSSAAASGEAAAGSAAGSVLPSQTPAADGQAASSEQGGDPLAFLSAQSVQNEELRSDNSAGMLHFENLRATLSKYNENVLSLQGQIQDLSDTMSASGDLWDLHVYLSQMKTAVDDAMDALDPDALDSNVYSTLTTSLKAQSLTLETLSSLIKSQRDSLVDAEDSMQSAKNTLNDAINQVVKGTETLYIAILTMQDGMGVMERGLETLDRAVAITEKQQELGMASAYDVESIRHQRNQLQSQLESLKFQIVSSKLTLEGMCGMALNGTVELAPLPELTDAQLDAVNYDKALSIAMGRNVDVMNANIKFNSKSSGVNKHSLAAAKRSFAASFKAVCLAVPEDRRLVAAAQETLDFQQRTFDIAAKKYELGMLSHEEYLSAQNDLTGAKDDLRAAQRDLFSAYRAYENAVQYGLI